MRGPLNLKFENHFIIYQKRPLRERFGTGRLHSELWDWGVKFSIDLQRRSILRIIRLNLRSLVVSLTVIRGHFGYLKLFLYCSQNDAKLDHK